MSASAGRVLLIHKGDYSSGTTYNPMDEVLYEGSTYVCKATSTGNAPTNTTYWQMMAQKGENGSGIPTGGTTGQVPMKASDTDYDIVWGDVETDALSIDEAMEYELIPGKNKVVFNPFVGTRSNVTVSISNAETNEINLNGTSTSSDWICISNPITNPVLGTDHGSVSLKAGTYVLSCPQASALTQHFYISVMKDDGTELAYLADNSSRQFSVNADTTGIFVMVYVDQITLTNQKLQAMICTQEDWNKSHTYEPYYVPVKDRVQDIEGKIPSSASSSNKMVTASDISDVYEVMGQNGAKNYNTRGEATSQTINNITFTMNDDDSVTISTNGAATALTTFIYHNRSTSSALYVPEGNYLLNGCEGGSSQTYSLAVNRTKKADGSNYGTYRNYDGEDTPFTVDENTKCLGLFIEVNSGVNISTPITIKPMIRLASDTDNTYQPHAMTNKELTDRVIPIATDVKTDFNTWLANIDNQVSAQKATLYRLGKLVVFMTRLNVPLNHAFNASNVSMPSFLPVPMLSTYGFFQAAGIEANSMLTTGGKIYLIIPSKSSGNAFADVLYVYFTS